MPTNALVLTRLLLSERSALVRQAEKIVGSRPAAEDVAQALWLNVQKVSDEPPIGNPRAFLFRLARNLAFDRAKAERSRSALFAAVVDDDMADETPLADRTLLGREALERVTAAMEELSPRCREVVLLRRVEGLSPVGIGKRLGISRQMVSRYVAQAMEHCLKKLDDRG